MQTTVPLRVVQWATGNIGVRSLREVIRNPQLELAGLFVYDAAKVGVDAGTLCGEPLMGIAATNIRTDIFDLGADCVLYMPSRCELDDVTTLLALGTNIVTTCGEFHDGGSALADDDRSRVLDACTTGNASIYSTGSSPGFITETLPLALLSMQRHVAHIYIEEFANLSLRDSPYMLFELMGYSQPLASYDERRTGHLLQAFRPSLLTLTQAAGFAIDNWSVGGAVAAARHDICIAAGTIPAGTIAAQRTTIVAKQSGVEKLRFTTNWYCTDDLDVDWDLRATGWRVRIDGDAPFDVDLTFPIALEDLAQFTPAYTANRPVNAVPYICAAEPGIVSALDLPPITPSGSNATS